MGTGDNLLNRRSTNSACGIIDDSANGLLVFRVYDNAEISQNILNFFALIEAHSSKNAIWDGLPPHLFLKDSTLRIGAIQNGKIAVIEVLFQLQLFDISANDSSLLLITIDWTEHQLFALGISAVNVFVYLSLVVENQTIGRLYNILRRAIVLFEFEELCLRVDLLKIKNVINICAPKTINTLCVISYRTHMMMLLRQLQNNTLLHVVCILILINQHILKSLRILDSNIIMLLKEAPCENQQIVEVHCVGCLQTLLVCLVDLINLPLAALFVSFQSSLVHCIGIRQDKMILCHANLCMYAGRLINLIIKLHFFDDTFQQRPAV